VVLTLSNSGSGCSVHAWRTIRTWSADRPQGLKFVTCSSIHEHLTFRSQRVKGLVARCLSDCPLGLARLSAQVALSAYRPRVGYRPSVFAGTYWWFGAAFCGLGPPNPRGPSAQSTVVCLCPFLLELRSRL
jgi:hypothetical protein